MGERLSGNNPPIGNFTVDLNSTKMTTMADLDAYTVIAAVVEAESFTGAAQALGRTKSAVSKAVGRLEDRLGVRLLNRTTRRIALPCTRRGGTCPPRCGPL